MTSPGARESPLHAIRGGGARPAGDPARLTLRRKQASYQSMKTPTLTPDRVYRSFE